MPIVKQRAPLAAYRWNPTASRYIRRDGRFVTRATVRNALTRALTRSKVEMQGASQALKAGRITLGQWQTTMSQGIRDTHLYAAAVARGGFAQLTAADYGRVGQLVRDRYNFLNRFADQIAGGLPLDGRFLTRSGMYVDSSMTMFHLEDRIEMRDVQGMSEERNMLSNAEHCDGCLGESARGWVEIGTLKPIGSRTCLTHDRCWIAYR